MSTGSDDKPGGSSLGRPAADTPQRLVVRSLDPGDSLSGASDTAVAMRDPQPGTSLSNVGSLETPAAGTAAYGELLGTTLSGRYLVIRKIGQGGMGAVYEATHTLIGKQVAVKVLLEKYTQREAIVARLKQEAQLASSVRNEHIIEITDFGTTDDGRTFVVMELLDGESLAECLARESKLPEQRLLRIASQTASALAAAHAKGVVHRDIKPENLFLLKRKEQDFVKVVDFGISKSLRQSSEEEEQPRLTQTGMVLGTPLYMSPEQARGDENLDHRVDIYALGVIMYEAASGRVPVAGNNDLSVISQVLNEQPTPLRELRPEISEEFEAIVMHAMTKDRDERYASANDMLADITAVLDDPTHSTERAKITGPRRLLQRTKIPRLAWAIGGIGVAVGGVTIAVFLLMGGEPSKPKVEPPAVVKDAAVAVILPPDAPPAPETIDIQIESEPPGASIWLGDRNMGNTPTPVTFTLHDQDETLIAQLPGYDDAACKVNPIVEKHNKTMTPVLCRLHKSKGTPKTLKRAPGQGSGSGSGQPENHTIDGLGGYPGQGGGSLPKK